MEDEPDAETERAPPGDVETAARPRPSRRRWLRPPRLGLLALAALVGGGALVADRTPSWIDEAQATCLACVGIDGSPARWRACVQASAVWSVPFVPWERAHHEAAREACRREVRELELDHAARIEPSRAHRDRVAAEIAADDGVDQRVYLLMDYGAEPAALALTEEVDDGREAGRLLLSMALRSRSLDTVRRVVLHAAAEDEEFFELDHRVGAWLCLLGHEELGRERLARARRSFSVAPPDALPDTMDEAELTAHACGGPVPEDDGYVEGAGSRWRSVTLALGTSPPSEVFASVPLALQDDPWNLGRYGAAGLQSAVRRHALARALRDAEGALELDWVRYARARGRDRCDPARWLAPSAIQIDPALARSASARLLAWLEAEPAAARRSARRLALPLDDTPTVGAYVRAVAADLLVDAAHAEAARGEFERAREDVRAASALSPFACPIADHLVSEPVDPGPVPEADAPPIVWARWGWALHLAGRSDEAFDASVRAMREARTDDPDQLRIEGWPRYRHWIQWQVAGLSALLGRPVPDDVYLPEHVASWLGEPETVRRAHPESLFNQRRRESPYYYRASLPQDAWRMLLVSVAAGEHDAEVLLDRVAGHLDGRAALGARYLAARWRGDDAAAARWLAWIREVAALASDPARAHLVWAAMGAQVEEALEPSILPEREHE